MGFTFKNKLEIEIEDHTYTVDISSVKVVDAVQRITTVSLELGKKGAATTDEVNEYIEEIKIFINLVLGDGEFDVIFEGKVIRIEDICDLSAYILDEIGKFKNDRISRYGKLLEKAPDKKLN